MISLEALTIGKQQQWLESQPEPKTKEERFGIGVGAANITRLFPSGWIVYLALMGSAAGTIMLVKPADATEEMLSLRRISGLALVISVVALWDGLIVTANLPITIGLWVFPAWLVCLSAIAFLVGAFLTLSASTQRARR